MAVFTRRTDMHRQGFTIVELAVVIAVLGILAAITMGAYGQWRATTAKKEVQSDLIAASAAMENTRNFGSGYPLSIPSTFKGSSGVNLTYKAGGTAQAYCLDASSIKVPSVTYYLSSANGNRTPAVGTCP